MGFYNRIFGRVFNLRARDKPGSRQGRRPDFGMMRSVYRVRGDNSLSGSEAIYAAVSRISNTIAMLPMHLYRGFEIVHDDPRERIISYMPNATMTPFTFQQTMEAFRNTEGNAYAMLVRGADDTLESLDVLDAARVTPMRNVDDGEMYYTFTLDDATHTQCVVHSSQMIVLRHISANGEKGIRPIDVLAGTLSYARQIAEFSLEQLSGVNHGILLNVPNSNLSRERKDALISQFMKAYRDSGGHMMVLDGGLTATPLNNSPVDSNVLDVERITRNRVATVYNIPPHMLGDYSDTSYSTAEQSTREYLDMTILPIIAQWEQELNLKLLTWTERQRGYAFRFDITELLRADAISMANVQQIEIRGGIRKINEIRREKGLPDDPNGDVLLISRDLVRVDQLVNGTTPEPPEAAYAPTESINPPRSGTGMR